MTEHFYNGLKESEIAEKYGLPLNTVKTNIRRAKQKMASLITDKEKKENIRLHSVAWLMWLLFTEDANALPSDPLLDHRVLTSVRNGLAAKSGAAASGSAASGSAAAAVTAAGNGLASRLIAGALAVTLLAGGAVGGIALAKSSKKAAEPSLKAGITEQISRQEADPAESQAEEEPQEQEVPPEVSPETQPEEPQEAPAAAPEESKKPEETLSIPAETAAALTVEQYEMLSAAVTSIGFAAGSDQFDRKHPERFHEVLWKTLYWAADAGVIPTEWNSFYYGYAYKLEDAEQFLLRTFDQIPEDLYTSCPSYMPFIVNDGTYLVQDSLPYDNATAYRIFRIESPDPDHLLIYRTSGSVDSLGGHRSNTSYSIFLAERNESSEIGWAITAGHDYDPDYYPFCIEEIEPEQRRFIQPGDVTVDDIFGENAPSASTATNKRNEDTLLTLDEAVWYAEEYWGVEHGELYGPNAASGQGIYLMEEGTSDNGIPYYRLKWYFIYNDIVQTADVICISKLDGSVIEVY